MSKEKFVICPQCGAIVNKDDTFCGYCGTDVHKPKVDPFYQQQPIQPQQPASTQPTYGYQMPPPSRNQQTYTQSGTATYMDSDLLAQSEIGTKIQRAYIFAWLTFCISILAPIFLGLTLYYALGAKKLGSRDPKITFAITLAVVGTVVGVVQIIFYLWNFGFFG
ncbi:MAG: zinc ribbon domain-containing protein [Candidatus Heimdallarchaeota archaeon]|nr:zinc ribbon domain-containing protein [Candidatus Heimdallarchaeota archaeon]